MNPWPMAFPPQTCAECGQLVEVARAVPVVESDGQLHALRHADACQRAGAPVGASQAERARARG